MFEISSEDRLKNRINFYAYWIVFGIFCCKKICCDYIKVFNLDTRKIKKTLYKHENMYFFVTKTKIVESGYSFVEIREVCNQNEVDKFVKICQSPRKRLERFFTKDNQI